MGKTKLFLSYGRRDAEKVADRIKQDLEAEGYEVWMDRSDIKAGTAWESEITRGLEESKAMVALLSPHSVRREGVDGSTDDSVCLDEIAYARTIPGKILPVMVSSCSVPLTLCRLHCVDLCTWENDETRYRKGFADLLNSIQTAILNEVRYRSWDTTLHPWDFVPFLEERRKNFTGRHWLLEEVNTWLMGENFESSLLITGDPGVGKSAFVGQWVHLNPGSRLLAYHCCQEGNPTTLQPYCFIRSIAAMIASQLPEYEALLEEPTVLEALKEDTCRSDPARGIDTGILAPLLRISPPPGGVRCLLIDALDEAVLLNDGPNIVDVLASRLDRFPKWLKIVATTRNEPEVLKKLEGLKPYPLSAEDSRNTEDAAEFLSDQLSTKPLASVVEKSNLELSEAVSVLLERSKGNFLYIRYALDGLIQGVYHLDRPGEFPPKLTSFYEKTFQHYFPNFDSYDKIAGVLTAVLGAREPLDISLLTAASGLRSRRELSRALKKFAVFLPEREGRYVIFHRSFAEWLDDPKSDYCLEPLDGENKLAEIGWAEYETGAENLSSYMRAHLPYHLANTCQLDRLSLLLTDFSVLSQAWNSGREHEWMRHWRLIMARVDMVGAYQESIDQLLAGGADELEVARVTGKVGVLLRELGLVAEARSFVEKSVELLRSVFGTDEAELASAQLELAETYRRLGLFHEAPPLYEEALQIRERLFGPDSSEVADAVHTQCVYYNTCNERDVDRSLQLNERAVRILEKQDFPDLFALADALNDQGVLLEAQGQYDEALPFYQRSRKLFEQRFPEGHPELGVVISNIGLLLKRRKNYSEALALNEEGLKMRLQFVVPFDEKCQSIRNGIFNCHIATQEFPKALVTASELVKLNDQNQLCDEMTRCKGLMNLLWAAQMASNMGLRHQTVNRLIEIIQQLERSFYESTWKELAEFFLFSVRDDLQRKGEGAFIAAIKAYQTFLSKAEPPPYRALAIFYNGIADIWKSANLEEQEKEFRELANYFLFLSNKQNPLLIQLSRADGLLDKDELTACRDMAFKVFDEAIADDSDDKWRESLAIQANGFALRLKNEKNAYDLAEEFYQRSISLNPRVAVVVGNYAFFLTSIRKKHDKAEENYRHALDLNPKDSNILSNFAVFHAHVRKDYPEAEKLFLRASELTLTGSSIWGNFAVLRIIQNNLDEAMECARRSYSYRSEEPDRITARPLFCAIAVAFLEGSDPHLFIAQLKSLFLVGFDKVPWQAGGLIDYLADKLPAQKFELVEAIFNGICLNGSDKKLSELDQWEKMRPLPIDRHWPQRDKK